MHFNGIVRQGAPLHFNGTVATQEFYDQQAPGSSASSSNQPQNLGQVSFQSAALCTPYLFHMSLQI